MSGGQVRSVSVRLSGDVSAYVAGIERGDLATKKLAASSKALGLSGAEVATATATSAKALETPGRRVDKVVRGIGTAGKHLAVGLVAAEKKAADFNGQLATIGALSHGTKHEIDQLAHAPETVGLKFGYSATDAASAEESAAPRSRMRV